MSRAGTIFIAASLAVLSAAAAAAEPAVIGGTKLNLRSGPGPAFAVIAVIAPGTKVETQKCTDEWCRVKFGRLVGYASRAYIQTGTDSYASAAPEAAAEPEKPTLTGPRISQWRDSEWRDSHWRQFGWRNRMKRR